MPESTKELSGAELDRAIAERVMGWRTADHPEKHGTGQWMSEYAFPVYFKPNGQYVESCSFMPSEDIEAAMQLVDKMRADFAWDIESWATPAFTGWEVKLWRDGDIAGEHRHESLEVAICHAALTAIGDKA